MSSDSRHRLVERVNRRYDETMFDETGADLYENSDFHNLGYWTEATTSQTEACANLTHRVIDMIPEKMGSVLDVACGKGATTRELLKYYEPEQVTGINISEKQLDRCRKNVPGCTFVNMDAAQIEFPDQHFDNMICIEAAFHFTTREAFLREAVRVLKPGGTLAVSDVLSSTAGEKVLTCDENYVANLEEYREVWERSGFSEVIVKDVTDECRNGFFRHLADFAREKLRAREIDFKRFRRMQAVSKHSINAEGYYVLASGRKAEP